MEVKVKKRDYSSMWIHIFLSLILMCAAVVAVVIVVVADISKSAWFLFVFAGIFFLLGIALLIQTFLPEKVYDAVLKIKTEQDYMGSIITYMVFEPILPNNPANIKKACPCYTTKPNNLMLGGTYRIMVKPYNNMIRNIVNPNKYDGMVASSDGIKIEKNMDDKQLKEKERLLALGTLSKYDFDPERLKIDTSYFKYVKVTLPSYEATPSCELISNLKMFHIKESILEKMGEDIFYLTDESEQLIYQFARDFTKPSIWIVSDYAQNAIAQIEVGIIKNVRRTTVRMADGINFSFKPPIYIGDEYEVTGLDYTARAANIVSIPHITYYTKDGRLVAELNPEDGLPAGKIVGNTQVIKFNFNQIATPELLMFICCARGMR